MTAVPSGVPELRPYEAGDEPAVLVLLGASLGWVPDELHARLFAWKHVESPFGASPAWVATVDGEIVGFRTFLRWEFELDGQLVRAVRAVDTATHPDHQGRGVFTALTEHALAALRDDGVAFVFNTPNERSRPGYLRMGWRPVRKLPVLARPRSLTALPRLARARVAADKWSVATNAGGPVSDALDADPAGVADLLAALPDTGLRTHRTAAYLTWRYGFPPLCYRAVTSADGPSRGTVIFRLRRRGPALEAVVCEELVPPDEPGTRRALLARLAQISGADYLVRLGDHLPRAGFLPVPGQGPTLVCRPVTGATIPGPDDWHLELGDIELF
jgi:GNAT superfamily N-acetyltransferase